MKKIILCLVLFACPGYVFALVTLSKQELEQLHEDVYLRNEQGIPSNAVTNDPNAVLLDFRVGSIFTLSGSGNADFYKNGSDPYFLGQKLQNETGKVIVLPVLSTADEVKKETETFKKTNRIKPFYIELPTDELELLGQKTKVVFHLFKLVKKNSVYALAGINALFPGSLREVETAFSTRWGKPSTAPEKTINGMTVQLGKRWVYPDYQIEIRPMGDGVLVSIFSAKYAALIAKMNAEIESEIEKISADKAKSQF